MSAEGDSEADTVPEYDDAYLDRVAGRLAANYDLQRDFRARVEGFDLYGELSVRNQKQFLHPSISFAHHHSTEHLFARRVETVRQENLDRLVGVGHELADEWITPSDEHFSTDFTFALVTDALREGVREYVSGFSDRTLLKFGYHGHYEINLLVVAPDAEELVASENADVAAAFSLWEPIESEKSGLLTRLASRLR
jgi:hypothetical protein